MGGSPENTVLHPLHQVQFATHANLKVLVVDDNATNRQILIHQILGWKQGARRRR